MGEDQGDVLEKGAEVAGEARFIASLFESAA